MYRIRVNSKWLYRDKNELGLFCQMYPFVMALPFDTGCVTIDQLEMNYGEYSRRTKTIVLKTFEDNKLNQTSWAFDKSFFAYGNDFVEFDLDDLLKIYKSDFTNKNDLLQYYLRLLKSFNWETHLGNQKISFFVNKYGMSEHTVIRYNTILEEMGLIYVVHSSGLDKNANIYCELKYKDVADRQAKKMGISTSSNDKRSLAMKYRHTIETGEIYSTTEMIRIADYILEHNNNEFYQHIKDNKYEPKILELGPFETFV